MKKTIILNNVELHNIIDASSTLIVWAHEVCNSNNKHDLHFILKSRLPYMGEVNTGGLPLELCSQRVLEMTLQDF